MERQAFTTPFGRRPVSFGQIAAQMQVRRAVEDAALPGSNSPAAINKWKLFRTLTEIRERLGVSDRALSVLNALLSFHQETALVLPALRAEEGAEDLYSCDLVVFPSNKALAARAHGMAAMTLWRHLKALTEAGLIIRRDSPNGKRYARRDASGADRFAQAFGFDLTPLVTRAGEFEALAEELRIAVRRRVVLKERISLLRRDVTKLIALGLDEALSGDWEGLRVRAMALMTPLRRLREDAHLAELAASLDRLRADATKALESNMNDANMMSSDHHFGMHQSNSNTEATNDLEPASEEEGVEIEAGYGNDAGGVETAAQIPLGLVLEACPDAHDYGPRGRIAGWTDFMSAAAAIRPMIGISPDAWAEAQEALGSRAAHIAVVAILQRSIHSSEAETLPGESESAGRVVVNGSPAIRSAGGYLRTLTEKARAGEFALGPVLMATIGQRLRKRRGRGQQ